MPAIDESIYRTYSRDQVLVYELHGGQEPGALANFVEQTWVSFPIRFDFETLHHLSLPEGVRYLHPRDVVIGSDLGIRAIRDSFKGPQPLIDDLLE